MTRWAGFVLGAILAVAAVHGLGVCDLVPVRDDVLAAGRAIVGRAASLIEARPESETAASGPVAAASVTGAEGPGFSAVSAPGLPPRAEPSSGLPGAGERPLEPKADASGAARVPLAYRGSPGSEGGLQDGDSGPASVPASELPGTDALPEQSDTGHPRAAVAAGAPDGQPAIASAAGSLPAASIWAPFRSRRSAEGFAGHLRDRFGSDLEVRRAGPGVYGVYLTAATEEQLADDLARLRSAGALPAPETRR